MRLGDLVDGIYTKPLLGGWADFEVRTISCDSRELEAGGLFVALSGAKFDGQDFIEDAIARGAKIIVKTSDKRAGVSKPLAGDVCVLVVDDPKSFLHGIGGRFYDYPSGKIKTIGVTGTNGKTTITFLIESIIHAAGGRCGVVGTINYRINDQIISSKNTTPGFLDNQRFLSQLVSLNADYCVMEVSSHALHQDRVNGINFSAGIFTNLTQDHLDYHKTMENYFKVKSLLFKGLSPGAVAVINADDPYGGRLVPMIQSPILTYAIDHPADVRACHITYHLGGSHFDIIFPSGKISVHTRFIGRHNIYNILAAFAWGTSQGLDAEIIRRGIEQLTHVAGRDRIIKAIFNY